MSVSAQTGYFAAAFYRISPMYRHWRRTDGTYLGSEHRAETVPPRPHGLAADLDVTLMLQVLDVPQLQLKPDCKDHSQADELGDSLEGAALEQFTG